MFTGIYSSAMRNGSRLLFAIALSLFVAGLLQGITVLQNINVQPFGPNNELRWGWLRLSGVILNAVSYTVVPLIGSLVIDRADRWIAQTHQDPR